MSGAVAITFPNTFLSVLPFDQGDIINPGIAFRYSAAALSSGLVPAWASDAVNTSLTLSQAASGARPNRTIVNNQPYVVFDGVNDVLSVDRATPTASTHYVVFRQTAAPAATQVIFALGGLLFGVVSSGRAAVLGTAGSTQSPSALTPGTVYVAAITINGGAITLEVGGQSAASTITVGTLDKLYLGASGTSAFFNGAVGEWRGYDGIHTEAQRAAEMASLRETWNNAL